MQQNSNFLQKKIINCKALDVDSKRKMVKVAISEMESIDRDEELIDSKAWNKTIKERGPSGSNEVWHLLDHTQTCFSALSKFQELGIEGKYLFGVSAYKDSFAWREVAWPLYEGGDFNQHSVGYEVVDREQKDGYMLLKELRIWEGSAVLWGANPNTPTIAVQKSLNINEKDNVISQLERLTKAIKLGKHEDDTHRELIILEIKRIQKYIFDLQQKLTDPLLDSTQPNLEDKEMCSMLSLMNVKVSLAI